MMCLYQNSNQGVFANVQLYSNFIVRYSENSLTEKFDDPIDLTLKLGEKNLFLNYRPYRPRESNIKTKFTFYYF